MHWIRHWIRGLCFVLVFFFQIHSAYYSFASFKLSYKQKCITVAAAAAIFSCSKHAFSAALFLSLCITSFQGRAVKGLSWGEISPTSLGLSWLEIQLDFECKLSWKTSGTVCGIFWSKSSYSHNSAWVVYDLVMLIGYNLLDTSI